MVFRNSRKLNVSDVQLFTLHSISQWKRMRNLLLLLGQVPMQVQLQVLVVQVLVGGAGQLFSRHAEESQQQGPLVGDTREGIAEDGGAEKEGQGCVLGRL